MTPALIALAALVILYLAICLARDLRRFFKPMAPSHDATGIGCCDHCAGYRPRRFLLTCATCGGLVCSHCVEAMTKGGRTHP